MKVGKTLILDTIRNIGAKKISFLSIISIMMLGVGGLLCIFNLERTMHESANNTYNLHNFMDFELVASMGISEEDVEEIKKVEGVEEAEGVYHLTGMLKTDSLVDSVSIVSKTTKINKSTLVAGKLPEKENECALNASTLKEFGVEIGDTVNLTQDTIDGLLVTDTYRVVGEVIHPEYLRNREHMVLLSKESFDPDAIEGRYIGAYVKVDTKGNEDYFSSAYQKRLAEVKNNLDSLGDTFTKVRTKDVKDDAEKQVDEAKTKAEEGLDEAKQKLEDGEDELNTALKEAEDELAENEKKLKEGRETLEKELAKAKKELEDGEAKLNKELADAWAQIEEGEAKAKSELEKGFNQLGEAEGQYSGGKTQYDESKRQYDEGVAQLEEARKQIEDGENQIVEEIKTEAGKIKTYADILRDLFTETEKSLEEIEELLPELKGDTAWEEFKALIAERDEIIAKLEDESVPVEEKMEILENLIKRIDTIYENLPSREQVREKLQEIFISVMQKIPEKYEQLQQLIDAVKKLIAARIQYEEAVAKLPEAEAKLKEAEEQLKEARDKLDRGWDSYMAGKTIAEEKIADAKKQYEEGKAEGERKLAEGWDTYNKLKKEKEAELAEAEEKLKEGRETFEKTKKEKESELEEGWETYHEKETEVKDQLAEAQDKVDNLDAYNYLVNSRDLNLSYLQLSTNVSTIRAFAACFIPLFLLVASLVCFSTIAIIVDEQKRAIGAVKALGLYNKEISIKFISFAVLATLVGNAGGWGLGYVLTNAVTKPILSSFRFDKEVRGVAWIPLILLFVGTVSLAGIIARMACMKLLKCSAIGLINGSEPVQKHMKGNKNGSGGNLYSNLIINNMRMDINRVLVSIAVILGSCVLIGFGFTLRHAYSAAVDKQVNDVHGYTLQVVFDSDTLKFKDEVKSKVEESGGRFIEARFTEGLIEVEDQTDAFMLVSGNPDELSTMFHVMDNRRKDIDIPTGGFLIPVKTGIVTGGSETVRLYDGKFYSYNAPVAGEYLYFMGNLALSDIETYESVYGVKYEPNSMYVKWDNLGEGDAENIIIDISDKIRILKPNFLVEGGDNVDTLFKIVTYICLFLSIMLTFMILVNFTNILVSRRMKEMLVMRINGFSLREVIGYVARESLTITILGIIVGVGGGIVFTKLAVVLMENSHVLFERRPYVLAWVFAALFNVAFTVAIDFIAFSKIGKVALTDIGKY
jgi:putative ABC transport system permease protein